MISVEFEWAMVDEAVRIDVPKHRLKRFRAVIGRAMNGTRGDLVDVLEPLLAPELSQLKDRVGRSPGVYRIEAAVPEPQIDFGALSRETRNEVEESDVLVDEDDRPLGAEPLWFYVGEAGDLADRFRTQQRTNAPLVRGLRQARHAQAVLRVYVLKPTTRVCFDGDARPVDLDSKLERVFLEHVAIAELREMGWTCLNAERRIEIDLPF
jgi:hypothetical protein